ncbi:amino acid ABC transporter substrate-binding protein [Parvularcula flava]|uniref:Amino acid ABC transporter substrate-binding protein n=1 Tax=Aquisalinus luteolus TaxID=1566827 RepID=A0A8J3EU05_9PROT|nr:transporter substrate-binding domain-containing protein [Aquisalinus luteolus]NHK27523.1 amino acid ABC transporter substrate-binding protein [Aquisalinus luteolus]GGH95694.1 hypothetical protein GCM10011355_12840 [Aquisalinus luteolus]
MRVIAETSKVVFVIFVSLLSTAAAQIDGQTVEMYTDRWEPYVRGEGDRLGLVNRNVDMVMSYAGYDADYSYMDFTLARMIVRRCGEEGIEDCPVPLAFPYYRNADRDDEVLFSAPIFEVTNVLFHNRRNPNAISSVQVQAEPECGQDYDGSSFAGQRVGLIKGFLYGPNINCLLSVIIGPDPDNPPEDSIVDVSFFQSEVDALDALIRGQIDYFPMAQPAGNALLESDYPDRRELIGTVEGTQSRRSVHVIAPRTTKGQEMIDAFNESLCSLSGSEAISEDCGESQASRDSASDILLMTDEALTTTFAQREDIAEIVPVDGYPIIIGITCLPETADCTGERFALSEGTRAIILEWSDTMMDAQRNDRLYKTVMDTSRVVILNGPHAGKELWIKNMHIKIVK